MTTMTTAIASPAAPVHRAPSWAFRWLLVFVAVLLFRPGELVLSLAPLRLALASFMLAAGVFVATQRRFEFLAHPTAKWMMAYAVAMCISVPSSYWRSQSVENILIYLRQIATFLVVFHLARNARAWRQIVWLLVLSQTLAALHAIYSYWEGSESRIVSLGTLFSDPNDMALNSIMVIPLTWWLRTKQHRLTARLALWGALGLLVGGIVASQSRGGLLAFSVVALLTAWQDRRRLLLVAGMAALAGAVLAFAPSSLLERYRTISRYDKDESAQIRLALWSAAGRMIEDHPVEGVGTGAFLAAYGQEYRGTSIGGGKWRAAHNTFLETAAEVGILGCLCWLMQLVSTYWSLRQRRQQLSFWGAHPSVHDFPRALLIAMVGYVIGAMFLSRGLDWVLALLMGLGAAWCFTPLAAHELPKQHDLHRPRRLEPA